MSSSDFAIDYYFLEPVGKPRCPIVTSQDVPHDLMHYEDEEIDEFSSFSFSIYPKEGSDSIELHDFYQSKHVIVSEAFVRCFDNTELANSWFIPITFDNQPGIKSHYLWHIKGICTFIDYENSDIEKSNGIKVRLSNVKFKEDRVMKLAEPKRLVTSFSGRSFSEAEGKKILHVSIAERLQANPTLKGFKLYKAADWASNIMFTDPDLL